MALCRLLELTPIGTNAFLRFQLEMQLRKLKVNPLKEKARFRRINVAIADAHTNLTLINQSTNCFLMMFFLKIMVLQWPWGKFFLGLRKLH